MSPSPYRPGSTDFILFTGDLATREQVYYYAAYNIKSLFATVRTIPLIKGTTIIHSKFTSLKQIESVIDLARVGWNSRFLPWLRMTSPRLIPGRSSSQHASLIKDWPTSEDSSCASTEDAVAMENPESLLCRLPAELVIQIMLELPDLSLWSLRQSSSRVFMLFACQRFQRLHGEPGLKDRYTTFSLGTLDPLEKANAAQLLRQDQRPRPQPQFTKPREKSYCSSCMEVQQRGENDPRMVQLRQLRFCEGCKERHAGIFFYPESLSDHDLGIGKLNCIGRLGRVTLCKHNSQKAVTWETVERKIRTRDDKIKVSCTNSSHYAHTQSTFFRSFSSFPRMTIRPLSINQSFEVAVGWDLPLLDIDHNHVPTTEAIRKAVSDLIRCAFENHKPCLHMLDGVQLRDFAYAGICDCFTEPKQTKYAESPRYCIETHHVCSCDRTLHLDCADCGAVYSWALLSGSVTLQYRYTWHISKPSSLAWLHLLDGVPSGADILNEGNRHLLWCDSAGCATGNGLRRWSDMVKQETWLHHLRFGKYIKHCSSRSESQEYEELSSRHYILEARYRMPPETLAIRYGGPNNPVLNAIKNAAARHDLGKI